MDPTEDLTYRCIEGGYAMYRYVYHLYKYDPAVRALINQKLLNDAFMRGKFNCDVVPCVCDKCQHNSTCEQSRSKQ